MNLLPEPAASSSSQALQGETETQPVEDLTYRYPELLSLPSLPPPFQMLPIKPYHSAL